MRITGCILRVVVCAESDNVALTDSTSYNVILQMTLEEDRDVFTGTSTANPMCHTHLISKKGLLKGVVDFCCWDEASTLHNSSWDLGRTEFRGGGVGDVLSPDVYNVSMLCL